MRNSGAFAKSLLTDWLRQQTLWHVDRMLIQGNGEITLMNVTELKTHQRAELPTHPASKVEDYHEVYNHKQMYVEKLPGIAQCMDFDKTLNSPQECRRYFCPLCQW
ncbi:hypothetical protein PoB_005698300 [Plakobranchus ocellatus]|uniref:Uncharacterized protein n=1 Tax=Plakobranchus ocellatus TaxID=259542 RepID=A0AAV4CHF4_9GAST|nr:hypothetical protein PoB_005698300 [Plakobranchus ocellatus]